MRVEPEIAAGARRELHLLDRPFLPLLRVAANVRRGKGVERVVKGRVDRDELALEMGGELGDLDTVLGGGALQLVAIGLALRSLLEVDQPGIPGRDLHALVAERGRPAADPSKLLNGGSSPTNCARKIAGPLMVFMCPPCPLVSAQAFAHCARRKSWPNW